LPSNHGVGTVVIKNWILYRLTGWYRQSIAVAYLGTIGIRSGVCHRQKARSGMANREVLVYQIN
jgi:hypothetical protein